ncbi:ISLre2 family transposase [Acidaminococcus sp. NSJ-142]|nr:ISLre2 family transposase [Acidaminococcus hominis]MCD2434633.1 ISLre2 family transposase [Acidaminococcus hominis]
MINTIVNEKGLTFKDFEIKIFQEACRVCREYTKTFLESYDRKLMQERDKKAYRNKGGRKTSVKTLFGEVEYSRNVYETTGEDGLKKFVFLLDEMFSINNVGLISQNMAEQLVAGITELSYRSCAEKVSAMTGQCISAMGVWNVIQTLGQQVSKDEQQLVCAHKQGQVRGSQEAPVLFEETDGVHVSLQGEDRRHRRKSEIKVGIAYDGWKEIGSNRYELDGKVVVAGFSSNKDFQEYREAAIAETYNLDETQVRVLNGDGAPWIKNVKDKDTHFQLDPFHRNKAIKELVPYKDVRQKIHGYLKAKKVNDLLAYLEMYRDSLPDDEEASQAEKLLKYFTGNRAGLLSYQEQGIELPKNPDGLVYKNMGTIFEELIRRFNEEDNEEAGEHWTPRDVVELMADLAFYPVEDQIKDATYSCYDPEAGPGGASGNGDYGYGRHWYQPVPVQGGHGYCSQASARRKGRGAHCGPDGGKLPGKAVGASAAYRFLADWSGDCPEAGPVRDVYPGGCGQDVPCGRGPAVPAVWGQWGAAH